MPPVLNVLNTGVILDIASNVIVDEVGVIKVLIVGIDIVDIVVMVTHVDAKVTKALLATGRVRVGVAKEVIFPTGVGGRGEMGDIAIGTGLLVSSLISSLMISFIAMVSLLALLRLLLWLPLVSTGDDTPGGTM